MSLGYAEKLSFIEDAGNVGMTEFFDPSHLLQDKVKFLTPFYGSCLMPPFGFVLIVICKMQCLIWGLKLLMVLVRFLL